MSKWNKPKIAAEITTAPAKAYLDHFEVFRVLKIEFCRKPRKKNSSQTPAKAKEATTAANPEGEVLRLVSSVLDCSTAWLTPNMAVKMFETAMFRSNSRAPQANPMRINLGFRSILT